MQRGVNELLTKEQLAEEFIMLFPDYKADYDKHLSDYSTLLGHVFFGDAIDGPLTTLLKSNHDKETIKKYVSFIEHMFVHGNDDVKNIVVVTILEYLGDDDTVLKNAFSYFSDELIEASKEIEACLCRRDITISHKDGKTITSW